MRKCMLSMLAMFVFVGCSRYEPAVPPPAPPATAVETSPPSAEPKTSKTETEPPKTVQTEAKVGVGAKGHYNAVGPVVTPASVYFRARERIAFEIQIPQAMNLFKATEGRFPNTHEEFMQRIVVENQISLPELPPDHRYIYDPKTGQLMVEKPASQ